jgi:hypothetical protein
MPRTSTSPRHSPSSRRRRTAIAELSQHGDNRTRYLVYALEGTEAHDAFLNRLFRNVPRTGRTRGDIRSIVAREGMGTYRLHYNTVVIADPASARRRLF